MANDRKLYKTISLKSKQARAGYVFTLPLFVGVAIIFIPNLFQTFLFSINDIVTTGDTFQLKWAGIKYFNKALFENPDFNRIVVESIGKLLVDIPTIVIFSLFIATLLNQKFRGRLFARSVFFIPVLLATGIVAGVESGSNIMGMMGSRSLISAGSAVEGFKFNQFNDLFTSLQFSPFLIDVVSSAANGIYSIVLASGIQIFIFLAALQEVPESLYEAARVEGCSQWELFWKITIPILSPQIVVTFVYSLVDSYVRTDSRILNYIHDIAFGQSQYAYGTAMYWIYFLVIGVIIAVSGLILSTFVHKNN